MRWMSRPMNGRRKSQPQRQPGGFLRLVVLEAAETLRTPFAWVVIAGLCASFGYQLFLSRETLAAIQGTGGLPRALYTGEWWAIGGVRGPLGKFWVFNLPFLLFTLFFIFSVLRHERYRTTDLEFSGRTPPATLLLVRAVGSLILIVVYFVAVVGANWTLRSWLTSLSMSDVSYWFLFHVAPIFLLCAIIGGLAMLFRRVLSLAGVVALALPLWLMLFFLVGATGGNAAPASLVAALVTKGAQTTSLADQLSTPPADYFILPPPSLSRFPEVAALERHFYALKQTAYMLGMLGILLFLVWGCSKAYPVRARWTGFIIGGLLMLALSGWMGLHAWRLHDRFWFKPDNLRPLEDPKKSSNSDYMIYLARDELAAGISQVGLNIVKADSVVTQMGDCTENRVKIETALKVASLIGLEKEEKVGPGGIGTQEFTYGNAAHRNENLGYEMKAVLWKIPDEMAAKSMGKAPRELIVTLSPQAENVTVAVGDHLASFVREKHYIRISIPEGIIPPFDVRIIQEGSAFLVGRDAEPFWSWGYCGFPLYLKPYAFKGTTRSNTEFGLIWPFPTHQVEVRLDSERLFFMFDNFASNLTIRGADPKYLDRLPYPTGIAGFSVTHSGSDVTLRWRSVGASGFYGGKFTNITPGEAVECTVAENSIRDTARFVRASQAIEKFYKDTFSRDIPHSALTPYDLDLRKIERAPELDFWDTFYGAIAAKAGFRTMSRGVHFFLEYQFLMSQVRVPERRAIDFLQGRYRAEQFTKDLRDFHLIRSAYKQDPEETMSRIRDIVLRPDWYMYILDLNRRDFGLPKDPFDYVVGNYPRMPEGWKPGPPAP